MKLTVDWELCQGHGKCYMSAPDLFEPDDTDEWGRARVLVQDLDAADSKTVNRSRQAIAGCPEQALALE